jgi:hypothetical protein
MRFQNTFGSLFWANSECIPPFAMEAEVDPIAGYIHNKPNIYPLGIL